MPRFPLVLTALLLAIGAASPLAAGAPAPTAAPAPHVLPFISDDYSKALEEARARKVPIFIEAWAPW